MRSYLLFYINGQRHQVDGSAALLTVSEYLRERLRLTGTKVVCAEGDCGACTVVLGRPDGGSLSYRTIDACIAFLFQIDGCHVITVEGLRRDDRAHPVQESMVTRFGSQCGFCTPGVVVTLAALLERTRASGDGGITPDSANGPDSGGNGGNSSAQSLLAVGPVRRALTGNLCRCTGYQQIFEAATAVDPQSVPLWRELYPEEELFETLAVAHREDVLVEGDRERIFIPTSLQHAVEWLTAYPASTVFAGGTDLGVRRNKGSLAPREVLALSRRIAGIADVEVREQSLIVGAMTTWTEILDAARRVVPELARLLELFGAEQIRNAGTIGGNIANASPIGDSLPFLVAVDATLELVGPRGPRTQSIADFFLDYKETALEPGELIVSVEIPLPRQDEQLRLYKMSRRRDLDIASFTAALLLRFESGRISRARIAAGGVGPTVLRLLDTETHLAGKEDSLEVFAEAGRIAGGEIRPISDVRGSTTYRRLLAENVLLKYYYDTHPEAAAIDPGVTTSTVPRESA